MQCSISYCEFKKFRYGLCRRHFKESKIWVKKLKQHLNLKESTIRDLLINGWMYNNTLGDSETWTHYNLRRTDGQ